MRKDGEVEGRKSLEKQESESGWGKKESETGTGNSEGGFVSTGIV